MDPVFTMTFNTTQTPLLAKNAEGTIDETQAGESTRLVRSQANPTADAYVPHSIQMCTGLSSHHSSALSAGTPPASFAADFNRSLPLLPSPV